MARGICLAFSNCTDPARHDEFNRWYSHIHLPDLEGAPGLMSARRFANVTPGGQPSQYLGLFEFDSNDLDASADSLRRLAQESAARGRNIDCRETRGLYLYREIDPRQIKPLEGVINYPPWPMHAPPGLPALKPLAATLPNGISYVLTECTDPAREEEFNRWYSHTHLPDLSVRAGQLKATRYRNVHPDRGPSTYMGLYEWLGEDVRKTAQDAMSQVIGIFEHRHIDCLKFMGNCVFQEIDAGAYKS
jgi:hypothetical protein